MPCHEGKAYHPSRGQEPSQSRTRDRGGPSTLRSVTIRPTAPLDRRGEEGLVVHAQTSPGPGSSAIAADGWTPGLHRRHRLDFGPRHRSVRFLRRAQIVGRTRQLDSLALGLELETSPSGAERDLGNGRTQPLVGPSSSSANDPSRVLWATKSRPSAGLPASPPILTPRPVTVEEAVPTFGDRVPSRGRVLTHP